MASKHRLLSGVMRGHDGGSSTGVGILARLSAAIMAVLALIVIPIGAAGAQEAYPPAAIVNLIDPFGCAPTGISGGIGTVQPGSTLTGTLTISGVQVDQADRDRSRQRQRPLLRGRSAQHVRPRRGDGVRYQHGRSAVHARNHRYHRPLPGGAAADRQLRHPNVDHPWRGGGPRGRLPGRCQCSPPTWCDRSVTAMSENTTTADVERGASTAAPP